MEEFKRKIRLIESRSKVKEKQKIIRKIDNYNSSIQKLVRIGNTENTIFKIAGFILNCEILTKLLFALIIAGMIMIRIRPFMIAGIAGVLGVLCFLLVYLNFSIPFINDRINLEIYQEIKKLEHRREWKERDLKLLSK